MITRRQALARLLGGSVALAAADIWIPGERVISLPARCAGGEYLVFDLMEFWSGIAEYAKHPSVMFEIFNEPFHVSEFGSGSFQESINDLRAYV